MLCRALIVSPQLVESGRCTCEHGLAGQRTIKVQLQEYERMRAWLAHVTSQVFPAELLRPEINMIDQLDRLASQSPAKARQGFSLAIGDMFELTDGLTPESVSLLDLQLEQLGLPTFSEMRCRSPSWFNASSGAGLSETRPSTMPFGTPPS